MPAPFNLVAAFVEYCKGSSLEEIAHGLAIPIDLLVRREREERWAMLAPRVGLPAVVPPEAEDKLEWQQERIRANRERNLVIAQKMQEDLLDTVVKLREGKLKVKRVFANGSSVELDPSMRDRCDIALYARNVADLTYRALGDIESAKNAPDGSTLPATGQITIVLPAPVAAPRQERAIDVDSEVVTISPPAAMAEKA